MAKNIVVWTPHNARVWWACPTCKVEGGVTPPVALDEMLRRFTQFKEAHKACTDTAKESKAWRG